MAEFGTLQGLSVLLPDREASIRANAQLQRQAKISAQNHAKMFADDFEYNNAMNAHDNPIVKEYANGQLTKIGKYLRENPDWETNPMKRVQYKQMLHELKDNPELNRGLQSDANFSEASKWLANPKNAKMANNSKIAEGIKQQQSNYLKYGNQQGEDGLKNFGKQHYNFIAPEDNINTLATLEKYAKSVHADYFVPEKKPGFVGAGKWTVSDNAKLSFSKQIFENEDGVAFDKQWENLPDNEKSNFGHDKNKWLMANAEPFFPTKPYEGQQPKDYDNEKGGYSITPIQNKVLNLNVKNEGGGVAQGTTTARKSWELKANIPIGKEVQQLINPNSWEIESPVGEEQFTTSSIIEIPVLNADAGKEAGKPVRTSIAQQYPGSVTWKKYASGVITKDVPTGEVDSQGQPKTKREAVPYYVDYDVIKPVLQQRKIKLQGQETESKPTSSYDERKSVGEKSYVKRGGKWYEE